MKIVECAVYFRVLRSNDQTKISVQLICMWHLRFQRVIGSCQSMIWHGHLYLLYVLRDDDITRSFSVDFFNVSSQSYPRLMLWEFFSFEIFYSFCTYLCNKWCFGLQLFWLLGLCFSWIGSTGNGQQVPRAGWRTASPHSVWKMYPFPDHL